MKNHFFTAPSIQTGVIRLWFAIKLPGLLQ